MFLLGAQSSLTLCGAAASEYYPLSNVNYNYYHMISSVIMLNHVMQLPALLLALADLQKMNIYPRRRVLFMF